MKDQDNLISVVLIVKNEEEVIERCLRSVMDLTDQILVVDTGSTDKTKYIISSLGIKYIDFKWCDDFAAARNFAFDQVSKIFALSKYIFWLDADDIVKPQEGDKILGAAQAFNTDIVMADYVYGHDNADNPISIFARERLIKREAKLRWAGAVHEYVQYDNSNTIARADFVVHQYRPGHRNHTSRNLDIFKKLSSKLGGIHKMSTRDLYYYGKECSYVNDHSNTIELLNMYIKRGDAWWEDKASAYLILSRLYFAKEDYEASRREAFNAIITKHSMAEAYCMLGLINAVKKEWAAAANWYEIALTCEAQIDRGILGARQPEYYTYIPYGQLCLCYSELGQFEKANKYNELLLKSLPNDNVGLSNRKKIQELLHQTNRKNGKWKRLNLGCGGKAMPGYVNCDLFPGPGVDETFSLDNIPYDDQTISAIHSEHAIEHLPRERAFSAFKEWARVLIKGGELIIKCPDLELCCKEFLNADEWMRYNWWHHTMYGVQVGQSHEPDEGQFHYCGFTKDKLRSLLEEAGFVIDYLENYDGWDTPSIACRAVRSQNDMRIGWLTPNDWDDGPTRIRKLNVDRWLRAFGYKSKLISNNDLISNGSKFDVAIIGSTWDDDTITAVKAFKELNKAVVVDICEDYFSLGWEGIKQIFDLADLIVCCSQKLADKCAANGYENTAVIEDGVETIPDLNCQYDDRETLLAGWVGYGGNAELAEGLRPLLKECGYDLITIHEHADADAQWNRETWPNLLINCDIAIAPQRPNQDCKSNNKLSTYQGLGLPTVAYPLQSYLDTIESPHIETFLQASNETEWRDAFLRLKDVNLRSKIGRNGKESSLQFRSDKIKDKWFNALQFAVDTKNTVVDLVLSTYNNPEYLELCLRSIKDITTEYFYNIIVVDSGKSKNIDHEEMKITLEGEFCLSYKYIIPDNRTNFSQSNNIGIKASTSEYLCILNDDLILTPGWLKSLKSGLDAGYSIIGPFSNCDQGWLHNEDMIIDGVVLHPGMVIPQIKPILGKPIYDYGKERSSFDLTDNPRGWIAFYCVMMKRDLIEQVGLLDEEFANGCEDVDYCYRAAKMGHQCLQKMNNFVFHFGGTSRKFAEKENYEAHHTEDKINNKRLSEKYDLKTVVFYSGPSFEKWSPKSIVEGGIGGSETALIRMAEELNSAGYRVVVFNDCRGDAGRYAGIEYKSFIDFPAFVDMNYIDVFISSRDIDVFRLPIRANKKICWVHDIWLSQNKQLPEWHTKIDKFLCLSEWHKEFFASHHEIDVDRIDITQNGVDLDRFNQTVERDPYRFIYSSSPDRGLDILLASWPEIRKIEPRSNLKVFYGFDNWNKSISSSNNKEQIAFRDQILNGLTQPGIQVCGRVDQITLATEMLGASIWAYPAHFWETFCITALEAQAAGLSIITNDLCGLKTTVQTGIKLDVPDYWKSWERVNSSEYKKEFLEAIKTVIKSDRFRLDCQVNGPKFAKQFTWNKVAQSWIERYLGDLE